MRQKIYLVKKDPSTTGSSIEWRQLTREQFTAFTKSPAGKGRYFIRLTDDIDYECPEIFIEATYEDYRKWKAGYNRHQYLKEQAEEYEVISADTPVTADSNLVDTLTDDTASPEELAIANISRCQIRLAVAKLPREEQIIVHRLYLAPVPQKQQQLAQEMGIAKDVLSKRKKKILKKILNLLGNY